MNRSLYIYIYIYIHTFFLEYCVLCIYALHYAAMALKKNETSLKEQEQRREKKKKISRLYECTYVSRDTLVEEVRERERERERERKLKQTNKKAIVICI
jgi:hypothetical protein